MKERLKNVLLIINTILLIVCLVQISNLKTDIFNMRSNMGNQISNILTNVNNSYSYIEETLEKEASIVSNAEWEFGNMDIEARTMEDNGALGSMEASIYDTNGNLLYNVE